MELNMCCRPGYHNRYIMTNIITYPFIKNIPIVKFHIIFSITFYVSFYCIITMLYKWCLITVSFIRESKLRGSENKITDHWECLSFNAMFFTWSQFHLAKYQYHPIINILHLTSHDNIYPKAVCIINKIHIPYNRRKIVERITDINQINGSYVIKLVLL